VKFFKRGGGLQLLPGGMSIGVATYVADHKSLLTQ
jgi:hypothetical protein